MIYHILTNIKHHKPWIICLRTFSTSSSLKNNKEFKLNLVIGGILGRNLETKNIQQVANLRKTTFEIDNLIPIEATMSVYLQVNKWRFENIKNTHPLYTFGTGTLVTVTDVFLGIRSLSFL